MGRSYNKGRKHTSYSGEKHSDAKKRQNSYKNNRKPSGNNNNRRNSSNIGNYGCGGKEFELEETYRKWNSWSHELLMAIGTSSADKSIAEYHMVIHCFEHFVEHSIKMMRCGLTTVQREDPWNMKANIVIDMYSDYRLCDMDTHIYMKKFYSLRNMYVHEMGPEEVRNKAKLICDLKNRIENIIDDISMSYKRMIVKMEDN